MPPIDGLSYTYNMVFAVSRLVYAKPVLGRKKTHTHNNRTQTKLGNLSVSRIPAWRVRAQRNRHNYRYYRVVGWKRGEFMCYGITGVDASMLSTFSARARAHNVNELIIKCARARVFCVCLFVCV